MRDVLLISGETRQLESIAARLDREGHDHFVLPASEDDLLAALRRTYTSVTRCVTPILWVRPDSSFAYANPAALEMLGYGHEELTRMRIADVEFTWPPDYWEQHGYTRLKNAGVDTFETEIKRKDGTTIPVEITTNHVQVDDEELFFAFVVDIRERRERERALAAAMAEIEALKDQLQAENLYLQEEIRSVSGFDEIVGTSDQLRAVLHQVEQVSATDATVLILGETGTGKELIARAIHDRSPRTGKPLVKVNCAALPSSLIESELFGHERGAFTGAVSRRVGRFSLADGGTIFLDEIGDLPLELQAKLLRVLQEGEFEPVGSTKTHKVDVRVIAATNRDLDQAMEAEAFRSDLYYRLTVFPIHIPPLRDRPDDIPLLTWAFVRRSESRLGKHIETISSKVMKQLLAYAWPGNVRELENVIQRAMILSPGSTLVLPDLGPPSTSTKQQRSAAQPLEDVERDHIRRVLDNCGWRIKGPGGAAERLGLAPSTLRYRMKKLDISKD